ncbi:hypothetical protein Ahy_A04g020682 [Arachis hypogaea]|uniref:Uncharacterized protein n=1 Tax=Arachis hypogaea TaxID=3818 RepID=A0A445DIA7_ARAHY|nr:hypothetical protein Ahy_A04g020682 [Arachis hypogaea]
MEPIYATKTTSTQSICYVLGKRRQFSTAKSRFFYSDRWYKDIDSSDNDDAAFDPCQISPMSKDKFDEWCKPWHAALIVKVMGKRVNLDFMEQRLNREWIKKDEKDYSHALLRGPWMIAGYYLIVQRWKPFFLSSENVVKKIAEWICIPNLPIELYNYHFLWRVGSAIETMLKIDKATSIHFRGRFARIFVEIDLSKKLVPRISVLGSTLNIEHEGLHLIYFTCGKYGHRTDQCSETATEQGE